MASALAVPCHLLLSLLRALWLLQGVGNYRLDILASDVKAAVAALGHSRCTLVAHDWGGGVAWVTAGMYGSELIDRLVVIGLPHLGISSTNMSGSQYVKSLYMLTFQVCVGGGVLSPGWCGATVTVVCSKLYSPVPGAHHHLQAAVTAASGQSAVAGPPHSSAPPA